MDIKQYQLNLEKDLQTFKSEYDDLKAVYINFLTQAVYDSSKVEQVLDANKSLTDLVQHFISQSRTKFDSETINDLTNQIIEYQKEYKDIKSSNKKTKLFKEILNKENARLVDIQTEFTQYLWFFLAGILILIILIFTTPSGSQPILQDSQLSTM
jgi:dGTP triphosphohydrolase